MIAEHVFVWSSLKPLCLQWQKASWKVFVSGPSVTAVVGLSFGRYIVEPFFDPCPAPPLAVKLLTACGVSLVICINSWSVNWTARIQTFLTFSKLVALGLIITPGIIALSQGRNENFQHAFNSSSVTLDTIPLAFYSGMFAYSGWFYVNFFSEEVINPERTIPLAIVFTLILITVLYLLVNVAYYTVLTADEVLASGAVAVTFADRTLSGFSSVIQILVSLSCLGALTVGLFSASRVFFVASRENQWPTIFSMIHIQHHTPLPAVILIYPLVILMIFIGDLYGLLNLNSFPRWLFMGLVTLGLIRHRYKQPDLYRPFKVPIIIPGTFSALCLFIVATSLYSDPLSTGISCALTLSGVPVYYLMIKRQQRPGWYRKALYLFTVKLQILMQVVQQEIVTY
ncbi:cystine/glutamate transporter-like isoform X1 [Hypanus sabinus]|uniref:cystine/glutamate transporter-like isoform X1 n=1 Tax=Hypanus sabinus TaxID=79690 RepID=UPI0028C4A5E3|nr:cystine/glutamate transporter-like isoform X1 [Hypanus sabinus]